MELDPTKATLQRTLLSGVKLRNVLSYQRVKT